MSLKFSEMKYSNALEKLEAILFSLSPILPIILWRFGNSQINFIPILKPILIIAAIVLFGRDIFKKKGETHYVGISVAIHLVSVIVMVLYLYVNAKLFNLSLVTMLLSYNMFAPEKNYEDMIQYVKTHQKMKGFQSALVLEDLGFENQIISPLDIAITKKKFIKFFAGDFYSTKQSAILSLNLSFIIFTYLSIFIPTTSVWANMVIFAFGFSGAFVFGLGLRIFIAAVYYQKDLLKEIKGYLRIVDKPHRVIPIVVKGSYATLALGALWIIVALILRPVPAIPTKFGIEVMGWGIILFFPMVLALTYPIQPIWRKLVWANLKEGTGKQKKGKKKNVRRK